jgi:hypothetical protein
MHPETLYSGGRLYRPRTRGPARCWSATAGSPGSARPRTPRRRRCRSISTARWSRRRSWTPICTRPTPVWGAPAWTCPGSGRHASSRRRGRVRGNPAVGGVVHGQGWDEPPAGSDAADRAQLDGPRPAGRVSAAGVGALGAVFPPAAAPRGRARVRLRPLVRDQAHHGSPGGWRSGRLTAAQRTAAQRTALSAAAAAGESRECTESAGRARPVEDDSRRCCPCHVTGLRRVIGYWGELARRPRPVSWARPARAGDLYADGALGDRGPRGCAGPVRRRAGPAATRS